MDSKREIRQIISSMCAPGHEVNIIGTVVAGSVTGSTCDVQPIDGALITAVRLNTNVENYS